jgi:UDP-N-acetylglucosamine:LPS N-acetylglucosamine transferase
MKDEKKLRICLVASAGGHLSQLLKLAESWSGYDLFYIVTSELVHEELRKHGRVYTVRQCNRQNPLQLIKVLMKCITIVLHERPQVVISTGAAAGCIECFLGKLIGAKVIWVDSITNVEKLSLSGRMVRHIADMFFVQWPELTRRYTKVQFAGMVI